MGGLILFILSVPILTAIFLPVIIGSDICRSFVISKAAEKLQRPADIDKIRFRWSDGLYLEGISVHDDPVFSDAPIVRIGQALFSLNIRNILNRSVHFDILVKGADIRMIRNTDGVSNLEYLLYGLITADRNDEAPLSQENGESLLFGIPADLSGRIYFDDIFLTVDDRMQENTVELTNASVHLDIPSLTTQPVSLSVYSDMTLNHQAIPPLRIDAVCRDLFDADRMLTLNRASAEIRGALKGAELQVSKALSSGQISGSVRLNPDEIAQIAKPFLPPHLSEFQTAGDIAVAFRVSGDIDAALTFDVCIEASGLAFEGNLIQNRVLKPLTFRLSNIGEIDFVKNALLFEDGVLYVQDDSRLQWQGIIENFQSGSPLANLNIQASLNLNELSDLAEPFMPESLLMSFGPDNPSALMLKSLTLSGDLLNNSGQVRMSDLNLTIPSAEIRSDQTAIVVKDADIVISELTAVLKNAFPEKALMTASLTVKEAAVDAEKNIRIRGLGISDLKIEADQFRRSPGSVIGVAGTVAAQQRLSVDEVHVSSVGSLKGFRQSASFGGSLPVSSKDLLTLTLSEVSAKEAVVEISDKESYRSGFFLSASVPEIRINRLSPFSLDAEKLTASLTVGDMLNAELSADVSDSGRKKLNTKGVFRFQMTPPANQILSKFIAPVRISDGGAELSWEVTGRLPTEKEIARLSEKPPSSISKDLAFLKRLRIAHALKKVRLSADFPNNQRLRTGTWDYDIGYSFDAGSETGKISGTASVRDISELPGIGLLKNRLSARLTVSGQHDGLKSAAVYQDIRITPINLTETLDISVTGLDQILERNFRQPSLNWLNFLGGTVAWTVSAENVSLLTEFAKDIGISGQFETGITAEVTPKTSVSGSFRAISPGLDIQIKDIAVNQLQTRLHIDKRYRLSQPEKPLMAEKDLLSAKVLMGTAVVPFSSKDRTDPVSAFVNTMRSRLNPLPAISFENAVIPVKPIPLKIGQTALDISFDKGLPKTEYFRADLFGGTVIGSAGAVKQAAGFVLTLHTQFTGINTAALFPQAQPGIRPEDAEISGQATLSVPVESRINPLIQKLEADIIFTRIGSRSLERILYALDPHDSNETIVAQRRILRNGTPTYVRITVRNGNLFLEGDVDVRGVSVKIPKLERLNVSGLPGLSKIDPYLEPMAMIKKALEISSAGALVIDKEGQVRFIRGE